MRRRAAEESIGERFGRLIATGLAGRDAHGSPFVEAECDCGEVTVVRLNSLRAGRTRSCGCLSSEMSSDRASGRVSVMRIHNLSGSPEYLSWLAMKQRCLNPNVKSYVYYGGRGTTICKKWIDSFDQFYRDMGPRPEGTSIDRINPHGNYKPSNCRWADKWTQARNRRRPRRRKVAA